MLADLCGADERLHDRALRGGAVQHLLDRQHLRVVGGVVDELYYGVERLVWVHEQDVALRDLRKHGFLDVHVRRGDRLPRLVAQVVKTVGLGDRHEAAQLHGAIHEIDVRLIEAELPLHRAHERARGAPVDLKTDALGLAAVVKQVLHAYKQVGGQVLAQFDVGVARDPERHTFENRLTLHDCRDLPRHDLFDRDEDGTARRVGDSNETREFRPQRDEDHARRPVLRGGGEHGHAVQQQPGRSEGTLLPYADG